MKHLAKLAALVAVVGLWSCSDDAPDVNPGGEESNGDVYATLKLSLPVGSRSETLEEPDDNTNSSDGYESGKDYENSVGSVFVVLATQDENGAYSAIAFGNSDISGMEGESKNPTYVITFQSATLEGYKGTKPYVFAYCNATPQMQADIRNAFANTEGNISVSNEGIWEKNAFLMSNRDIAQPQTEIPQDLTACNTPATAFNLGTVEVQRAAARFDFMQKVKTTEDGENNEYLIYHELNATEVLGSVVLEEMALLNLSNTYYLLPRTSASADWTNPVICGRENSRNWVVSTNQTLKQKSDKELLSSIADINNAFQFTGRIDNENPAINFINGGLAWEKISAVVANDEDTDESTWPEDGNTHGDYHIWRYVTENTIPGFDGVNSTSSQRRGITTGVAFKARIKSIKDVDLDAGDVLYSYNNVILGNKEAVKTAAEAAPNTGLNAAYKEAFQAENLNEDGDLKGQIAGFKIYRPSDNGNYYVYYTYWNRHWDNNRPTQMGAMEFATVRNNIYKLYVDKINQFGHPGDPGDDPDPEDPDDPDESDKVYFKVSVRVLPWVVRINNIIL